MQVAMSDGSQPLVREQTLAAQPPIFVCQSFADFLFFVGHEQ
jgi:hypothetical protein